MEKIKNNTTGEIDSRSENKKRPSYIKLNLVIGATAILTIISCLFLFL